MYSAVLSFDSEPSLTGWNGEYAEYTGRPWSEPYAAPSEYESPLPRRPKIENLAPWA